jgi:hypothetical protein
MHVKRSMRAHLLKMRKLRVQQFPSQRYELPMRTMPELLEAEHISTGMVRLKEEIPDVIAVIFSAVFPVDFETAFRKYPPSEDRRQLVVYVREGIIGIVSARV